jgi:hypothetical protein
MATKIFSVEQLRLNNELLSGDSLDRLWYAGNQLTMGASAVPTGFNVSAGQGLVGGGTMDGSSLTLDVNLLAGGGLAFGGAANDYVGLADIDNSHVAEAAGIHVSKLSASGIQITAANGLTVQNNGVFNLGEEWDMNIDLAPTPGLDFVSSKLTASDIDNSHIKNLAGIHVTKLAASGINIGSNGSIDVENNGQFNLGEAWDVSVNLDGATLSNHTTDGISVAKVPNSLVDGFGVAAFTYDGGTASVVVALDPAEAVLMTGDQSIAGHKSFEDTLHVHGNLVIDGTTTQVDSTVVNIGDNIIVLNNDAPDFSANSDGGILIKRFTGGGTSTTAENASILWDNSEDEWRIGKEGGEEPIARAKIYRVALGLNDDEETVNISNGNWQATPVIHATVKNTTDTNPDLISCMVTDVAYTNATNCSCDVVLSAKPASANYVLELMVMAA